jgi:hypothetical protein
MPVPGGQGNAQLAQMLLGGQFQQLMARAGMTGMGLGHDQNIYDRIKAQNFQTQMQAQLKDSAQLDRSSYMNTMQGVAALAGVPFGGQQRLAAGRLADLAVNFAPMLAARDPDTLDKLSGSKGSAVVLAQRLAEGGRYRLDPVTGQMGVDPKSALNLTQNIMKDLYSDGNLANMKGISAGQLGGIYEQLSLRGMLGGAEFGREGVLRNLTSGMPQADLLAKAKTLGITGIKTDATGKTDMSGISAKDLDLLTKDEGIASKLRDFDANKIKASLKSYVGAISAMRDIFGDAGKPNAPIPELMRALEGLTTGSMGQVNPERLGQMARQTYYLAKGAGISADSAMVMQQDAAVRGQQLGIESPFAVLATQSSLGYNAALRSRGALATPTFGGMNEGALTQANNSMFQQGVASSFGTRLGTLLRLEQVAGKDATKNTDLGTVLEAVNTNKETVKLKNGREINLTKMSNKDIEELGASAGIDSGLTQQMLRQAPNAREALFNSPTATNYIRNVAQPADINRLLSTSTTAVLNSSARKLGITDSAVTKQLSNVSTEIMADLGTLSLDTIRNPEARQAAIVDMLSSKLPKEMTDKLFEGKTPEQQQIALRGLASTLSGNLDAVTRRNTKLGNYANIATLMNPALAAEGSARQMSEAMRNDVRDSLSGVASGSALRNAVDALKGVDFDDPNAFGKVIAKTFGGVDNRRIGDALRSPLRKVIDKQKEVEQIQRDIELSGNPAEKRALMEKFTAQNKELKGLVSDVVKTGESVNAYSATGLTLSDTTSAKASAVSETRALNNMAVIRADDSRVSDAQRADIRKKYEKDVETRNLAIINDTEIEASAPEKIAAQKIIDDINKNIKPTLTDAQANQAVITRRRAPSNRAVKPEDIDAGVKAGMTKEAATDYAMALRDQRVVGIEDTEIDKATGNSKDPEVRKQAIRKLVEARGETTDPKVIKERTEAFRKSEDARSLLETQRGAALDYENVITRALNPETVAKQGVGIIAQAKELQTTRQEQQNLLDKYAGGDEIKFLTGDRLTGIDDTKEGRKKVQEIIAQYRTLGEKAQGTVGALQKRLKAGLPDFEKLSQLTETDKALIVANKPEDQVEMAAIAKRLNVNVQDLPFMAEQANTLKTDYEREALRMVGKKSTADLTPGSKEETRFNEIVSDFGRINQLTKADTALIDANAKKLANSKQIEQLTDQDKALIEKTSKLEPGKVDAADKAALDVVAKRLGVAATDLPTILTDTVSPADKPKLAALASRIGGTVADLPRIRQLGKDVTAEATKESELLGASPEALAERLKATFKLESSSPEAIKELEGSLTSFGARSRAASLIGAQDRLTAVAGKGGPTADTAGLQKDYDEAVKAKNFDSFKDKYKLTDQVDFNRTVADLGTYGGVDPTKFSGKTGATKLADSLKVYDDTTVRGAGKSEPMDVRITGDLTGKFELTDSQLTSVGGMSTNARSVTNSA